MTLRRAENETADVCIIGGGASGLMCCAAAASVGAGTLLLEKNASVKKLEKDEFFDNCYLGKKLLITGKGRCNLTNECEMAEFMKNVPENAKFLFSALRHFPPQKVMEFFEEHGCAVKTERGRRVFPVSDKSRDVLEALKRSADPDLCTFVCTKAEKIEKVGELFEVTVTGGKLYRARTCVVCTGGLSYPQTGSDGDGYRFAKDFGHGVTPCRGSLVPIEISGDVCPSLMGLSLKNVTLSLYNKEGKKVFSELGEMLFTHFGVSGPLVLSCSAHMREEPESYRLEIDMKPALDEKKLDERLLSDFEKYKNKDIVNALADLLPKSMLETFVEVCGVDPSLKVNSLKKEQRRAILETLKHFPLQVKRLRPVEEAVITSGGVSVKEVNPSSMESRLVKGLFFAGEVLDVDAYTGGYNLQIAFATGHLAGISAAKAALEEKNADA